jgi:transcriptional regulator with XRE-family HTH domain
LDKKIDRVTLGDFLRTRRARVSPAEVGLPTTHRRRTPGLRREEVAQLAGVSATWYTWLEQGRDIRVSLQVLESIARALHLEPHETKYLIELANDSAHIPQTPPAINPVLQQILDHQGSYPAYLLNRSWDVIAWNYAALRLFGDFAAMPDQERNLLWYMFARPATRNLVVDWEERAQRLLAEFRADTYPYQSEGWFTTFVHSLAEASPEFAQGWDRHNVLVRAGGRRDFQHPLVGYLVLEQTTFYLSQAPEIKLVLHVPLDEHDSAQKLLKMMV